MAIQLPNPGLGDGQTGDNEYVMWTKVKDNFSNTTHAASKLVGTATGNVMEVGAFGVGKINAPAWTDFKQVADAYKQGICSGGLSQGTDLTNIPPKFKNNARSTHFSFSNSFYPTGLFIQAGSLVQPPQLAFYSQPDSASVSGLQTVWHTGNTTIDSNKNLKESSPVVRVFADHLDKIHEANSLPIKYIKNGVGDYTIEGTTGLREDGWQIIIPKDDHDNQLIAFTIEDDNGTIKLKTYKRTFNMTTFMFEPDLKTPLDIPEGRWVDLHFNDIPQEQLDEPIE